MKLLDIAYVNLVFLVLDGVEDLHASFGQKECELQHCNMRMDKLSIAMVRLNHRNVFFRVLYGMFLFGKIVV